MRRCSRRQLLVNLRTRVARKNDCRPSETHLGRLKYLCVIITHMTSEAGHLAQYKDFKKGAELEANPVQVRVESWFLATFHLIDACAARKNVHINKHQRVRHELTANPSIFGKHTEAVWMAFQDIEARLRPKFVYGKNWQKADFQAVLKRAGQIQSVCLEVLE